VTLSEAKTASSASWKQRTKQGSIHPYTTISIQLGLTSDSDGDALEDRSESRGRRWAERYLRGCSRCAALMQPTDQIRAHPARHHKSSDGIVRLCRLSSVLLGEIEQVLTWSKIEFRNWTTNLQLGVAQSWCHLWCSPCPPQGLNEKIVQEEVNQKHLRIVSIDWIQVMQKQKIP